MLIILFIWTEYIVTFDLVKTANLYFSIILIYLTFPSFLGEASKNVFSTFHNSDCRPFLVAL